MTRLAPPSRTSTRIALGRYFEVTDPRAAAYEIANYIQAGRAAHRHHAAQRGRVDGPGGHAHLPRLDQQPAAWRAGRSDRQVGSGRVNRDPVREGQMRPTRQARGDPAPRSPRSSPQRGTSRARSCVPRAGGPRRSSPQKGSPGRSTRSSWRYTATAAEIGRHDRRGQLRRAGRTRSRGGRPGRASRCRSRRRRARRHPPAHRRPRQHRQPPAGHRQLIKPRPFRCRQPATPAAGRSHHAVGAP